MVNLPPTDTGWLFCASTHLRDRPVQELSKLPNHEIPTEGKAEIESERRPEIDAAKGVLILLVVVGHDRTICSLLPDLWRLLYTFHVAGFFYLTFLLPTPSWSLRVASDRFVRCFWPYLVFVALSSIALRFGPVSIDDAASGVWELLWKTTIGSAAFVKRVSGFQLYWFLPAFFSWTMLRMLYQGSERRGRAAILATLFALHPLIGALPRPAGIWQPWGILTVAYLFPLGWIAGAIAPKALIRSAPLGIFATALVVVTVLGVDGVVNVGRLELYGFDDPPRMLFFDLLSLVLFWAVLRVSAALSAGRLVPWIGRHSLIIYLSHSLILQTSHRLLPLSANADSKLAPLWIGTVSVLAAVLVPAAFGEWLRHRSRLRPWLFPRGAGELREAVARGTKV